ncbi:glycosyl transferase [Salipaludibacillus neizhouensis]|uniref:Glycosyl transferase n=1 Tax=Salipaludibacillus neizhouensis TaxID=885475 RepID=A0A3A9KUL9_9BACI|nr:glycosyltransferase [Salipaludibacillus neizhouensis]RKL68296.1 glycosyl transferase [Salipaludibacillus neizhouensis]
MNKKRILFFIYEMGAGGAARTLLNIINNLDRNKFAPVLVTLNYNGSYVDELKEDVVFIKLDTKRLSRSIFKLAKIIRQERIDVVFSTIPRVNTIAIFSRILSLSSAKSVIREADNLGGDFKTNLQLLAFGTIYKMAHQIVSLSQGVKDNLVTRYKIKENSIKVIYNPIDLEHIQSKIYQGEIQNEWQSVFKTDDKVIVTAGRLVKQKDQVTLLHAFAKVNSEIDSQLVILGEGPLKEELIVKSEELNIRERVHFIGFQKNPYSYLNKADLFVLSSIHEGFSHVIAESLAAGTPVVSTDCKSGPSEVLAGGKYGSLCEVGNAEDIADNILRVLTLPESERLALIEKGFERARHFDAKEIVKQYETTFLETLS